MWVEIDNGFPFVLKQSCCLTPLFGPWWLLLIAIFGLSKMVEIDNFQLKIVELALFSRATGEMPHFDPDLLKPPP